MSIEKLLEKNLRENIKKRGGHALKFYCLSFSGMPDRLVLLPGGRVHFIELKDEGKKPSPIQRAVIKMLEGLGMFVRVIDSREKLQEYLAYVDGE